MRFVNINVSEFDACKHAALSLTGDARATIEELQRAVAGYKVEEQLPGENRWLSRLNGKKKWIASTACVKILRSPRAEVIGIVNNFTEASDIMVCAAGSMPGDLHKLWRTRQPGGYHMEYGYSCMGYEIAGGLGVKDGAPEREVYVLVGDGSYLMMAQEIVTALQEGYKLNIVLLDNHGFSSIGGLSQSCGNEGMGTDTAIGSDGKYDGDRPG